MRALILAAALAIAGAAHAAPPVDAPMKQDKREARAKQIGDRAYEVLPVKTFRVTWLHDSSDGKSVYLITFSLANIPGAPRTITSGVVLLPGEGEQKIDAALSDIARELQQILDNVKAGRPWDAGVTPLQPIEPSF